MTLARQLRSGSAVPLVTPFRNGEVDVDAVGRLVDFQAEAGTSALVVCGSTGENQALSLEERSRLFRTVRDAARGRLPVIAAAGAETQADTVALCAQAEKAGVDALLVITPRSTAASEDGVVAYFTDLASRTDLPVFVYNYPSRTQVRITPETLERIALARPNVVGLKQTDSDLRLLTHVRRRLGPEFYVFVGLEHLALAGLSLGAAGTITATANIVPREMADLFAAFSAGNIGEARRIHDALSDVFEAVVFGDSSPAAALKYLLRNLGLIETNEHRLPSTPPAADETRRLDRLSAAVAVAGNLC